VLAVFLDHVLETQGALRGFDPTPVAWYLGRMGVLLFFVLTSLVLLQSLERSALAGRSDALAFYLRRACRIYPLAVACVVAVVAFRIPATAWAERYDAPSIATLASNLALTMNLPYSPRVLSVLWTLPLELQMYLFLPAIHVLLRPAKPEERSKGGILLIESAQEKKNEGFVVEVGPGKIAPLTGTVIEPRAKKGDRVIYSKYAGTEISVNGEAHLVVRENDLLVRLED